MSLKLTAGLGDLGRIRDYVTRRMAALGVIAAAHDDIRLAVDEAVTNIIIHGYRGKGPIALDLSPDGQDLVVQLVDEAPPFNPLEAPPVDLTPPGERQTVGGYGLYLIQQAMDEVEQRNLEMGNELRLVKRGVVPPG